MKRAIALVAVVLALVTAYFFIAREDNEIAQAPDQNTATTTTSLRPDPSSATFVIDGEDITLSGGKSVREAGPGGALTEETSLMETRAYGDVNGDDKTDTITALGRFGGGSGFFVYVAGYVSGPVGYRGTNTIFLGDRIVPQSINISSSGVITVNYLDRSPEEPFAAEPTVPTTKQLVYTNGELRER